MNPYVFDTEEKTALFIDGQNLYSAIRALSAEVDYKKLHAFFSKQTRLTRALYYAPVREEGDGTISMQPLLDWLSYNGFIVTAKVVREYSDESGRPSRKASVAVDITIDMLELSPNIQHVVLFSGDGEFQRVLEAVQRKGVKTTVVSTVQSEMKFCSDDLRRQADNFVDLHDLIPHIGRDPAERRLGERGVQATLRTARPLATTAA